MVVPGRASQSAKKQRAARTRDSGAVRAHERDAPAILREGLLRFYDAHARALPFRETRDPYAVLVSEVMLQQTQVKTVLRYYEPWLQRFPTVAALARATQADVLHAWRGLGYYSRARRLQAAAQEILEHHGGKVPRTRRALLGLPGVGAYSAGAVASIAFGERVPVVDGNVIRVLCRFFGLRGDPSRAPLKSRLWQLASELVPEARPGDFNQALMELGATICTPRAPRCRACPMKATCAAHRTGVEEQLPETAPRRAPTVVYTAAALVRRGTQVLLLQVPDDAARWAGLLTFPYVELTKGETAARGAERAAADAGLTVVVGEPLARMRHSITRFRIELEAFVATARRGQPRAGAAFVPVTALAELALPAPHQRLAEALLRASAAEAGA